MAVAEASGARVPSSWAALAVVIVTYDSASDLERALPAVLDQLGEDDELVVVDNSAGGATAAAARRLAPGARVVEAGANLGFAAGCNTGARASAAPLLLFLNPDAVPGPGCLERLRRAGATNPGWGAWQALVTLPDGERLNTSGGVTHFLGMGWAGQHGQPVSAAPAEPVEVSFASGAALVVRRSAWQSLGGFDEQYFMYGEDLDLSLRLWLGGWGVGLVPAARVAHDYEFDKGARKWFLLERNRALTVLGDYPRALLVLLAPALAAFELASLAVAARGGWLGEKVRAQLWVAMHLPALLARRRRVQRSRRVPAQALARRLGATLDSEFLGPAARLRPLAVLQRAYWRGVLGALAVLGSR